MERIGSVDFIQLKTVSSTNTWAKEHALTFNPSHLTCITAEEQTEGRGRQNKKWISPKNANLYMSLYFVIPNGASYLANLGQIMALACAEMLMNMGVVTQVKWPNDLIVENKKIGGVLTETLPIEQTIGVILGLGLNINMPQEFLEMIDQPATSLHHILEHNLHPANFLQPLINHFISNLERLQTTGFSSFQPYFEDLLAYKGKEITVKLPQKTVHGICESVTTEGCLKIRLPTGQVLMLAIGEII